MKPRVSSPNAAASSMRSSNMPMPTVFAIVIAAIGIAIPLIIVMRDKALVALVGDGGRPEILW